MGTEARVLIIDADTAPAQKMGLALDGAGFPVTWCSFAPADVSESLRDFRPSVLLVHSELASPQLAALLARLEATPVPVALLCRDVADERFVRQLRTGVVELLQEPFSARLHVNRLRLLMAELPDRTGELAGRGGGREISELVLHLMRTRRTGGLAVGENGRAFFVRGVLKAARFRELTMEPALAAMTRSSDAWTYTEGADGASGLVDFMGEEEPFVVTYREFGQARVQPTPAPLEDTRPPAVATPPVVVDPEAARTPILFVDDDPAVVTMLSGYFSKKGYPVATAADGLEAMKLLSERSFEVVIADLNMPRLDGWGLLRMVREDLRTHETPMALFSAQDNYRESLRLLHAGAQAYFPKSLRLSSLEIQVRELVEPRRRFSRLVATDGGIEFNFGSLGPQWTLRALATTNYSGQLDARDSWANWRLWFDAGRLVECTALIGGTSLSGDRAVAGFLASKQAEGSLSPGTPSPSEGFAGHPTEATLARLVPWLNDEHKRAAEGQLARARALQVNEELYRLFITVGPPAWQPMVRMLCEQKLTPAEVIARLQVTPMEVAAVVRELLRRGVASLQA
ncbi:MAG: response regulator [Archangium sp.]|nr:response regulator [Archangium sp.]